MCSGFSRYRVTIALDCFVLQEYESGGTLPSLSFRSDAAQLDGEINHLVHHYNGRDIEGDDLYDDSAGALLKFKLAGSLVRVVYAVPYLLFSVYYQYMTG